jgi:hypothetical protein
MLHLKDSFYKELKSIFDEFPKHHMEILLGNFSAKLGREDFLNQQL